MFVDDLRTLEECILFTRSGAVPDEGEYGVRADPSYRGEGFDGDLFRLMGTSPPLPETALNDELLDFVDESAPPEEDLRVSDEDLADTDDGSFGRSSKSRVLTFARAPILPTEISQRNTQSALTMMLSESSRSPRDATGQMNSVTIYLPSGETLDVMVKPTQRISDIILRILLMHRKSGLLPALSPNVALYQLRIHDIDGEPDEDFPPLDPTKTLDHYGVPLSEYCLCQVGGGRAESVRVSDGGGLRKSFSIDRSEPSGLAITIELAGGGVFKLNQVDENAVLGDVIPLIARHLRMNVYTEHFVLTVSEEDQSRLMLSSPIAEMSWPIHKLGVKELKLQRKVFADTPTHTGSHRTEKASNESANKGKDKDKEQLFGYQEWLVNVSHKTHLNRLKKKTLSFGVERAGITISKAEKKTAVTSVVLKKEISSVASIEVVAGNPKAFRISWRNGADAGPAVYECEAGAKDCEALVAKVRALMES